MKLVITHPTVLKTRPLQSSQLKPNQKVEVNVEQVFELSNYRFTQDKSHYFVTFTNNKTYFVFVGHCKIEVPQTNKLNADTVEESKILEYVPQPDALTCQSAAIAQVTGIKAVRTVRAELVKLGAAGDPAVMGVYLKPRVKEYKYFTNASLNDLRNYIKEGYVCITHGWFTNSGHVITVVGLEGNNFIVDDPWHCFSFPNWTYSPWDKSGNNVVYSARGMYAACVASYSVNQAINIYNRGELDSNLKNMWAHFILN